MLGCIPRNLLELRTRRALSRAVYRQGRAGIQKDFAPHLRFVTQSLGLTEDFMGRGFVEFLPRRPRAPSHEAHLPGWPAVDPRQDADVRVMAPSTGPEIDLPALGARVRAMPEDRDA